MSRPTMLYIYIIWYWQVAQIAIQQLAQGGLTLTGEHGAQQIYVVTDPAQLEMLQVGFLVYWYFYMFKPEL